MGKQWRAARQSSCDDDGTSLQMFGALRFVLASSSVCPCVAQKIIGSKEGESTAFRELFPRVREELGNHFRIVTGDAAFCAWENAKLVGEEECLYAFGLKGNQPHLFELARQHGRYFSRGLEPLARTEERYRANTIVREFYACSVADDPNMDFPDARQFFYVNQTTYGPDGKICCVEQRYFVTSIPEGMFTPDQELLLVRLFWAIENDCNWTFDMVLGEDVLDLVGRTRRHRVPQPDQWQLPVRHRRRPGWEPLVHRVLREQDRPHHTLSGRSPVLR
jgi:hypothetical protein